jgi:dTDP-4-amino-4,6-dideoxygalactose transaminase
VTHDGAWAEHARKLALHGLNRDAWKRYGASGSWYYEVETLGHKYNMTDIAAALGLVQLRRLESMTARRASIAAAYTTAFSEIPEIQVPVVPPGRSTSWHLYLLRLELDRLWCDRAEFIRALAALNVGASVHFIPLHLHPYYRGSAAHTPGDFPVALREYQRAVSLPIYSRMSDDDVADVIDAVTGLVEQYRR